jgi:galactonate dehydratase
VAEWFAAARDAVGWDFERMLDCHGRLNLAGAVRLCAALAPFRLLVIEEPIHRSRPANTRV